MQEKVLTVLTKRRYQTPLLFNSIHQQRTTMIDLLASSSLPHNMMPLLHHDHQYLFRLTSTFGWDDAISLCDYLVQVIESVVTSTDNNNKSNEEDT